MPRQFFIAPLLCSEIDGYTQCAPKVNPQQVNYVAACQSHTVPNAQCMVLAAGDTTSAEGDSQLVSLIAENFDTPTASVPTNIRNRINSGLTSKGIQLTIGDPPVPATFTSFPLVRDFLTALGRWFDPNFVLENFWVSD